MKKYHQHDQWIQYDLSLARRSSAYHSTLYSLLLSLNVLFAHKNTHLSTFLPPFTLSLSSFTEECSRFSPPTALCFILDAQFVNWISLHASLSLPLSRVSFLCSPLHVSLGRLIARAIVLISIWLFHSFTRSSPSHLSSAKMSFSFFSIVSLSFYFWTREEAVHAAASALLSSWYVAAAVN